MSHSILPTFRFPPGTSIAQSQVQQFRPVTAQSPALEVMTDLTQVRAATVAPGSALAQAEQSMIHQGVRLLFVVRSMPSVDGIIAAGDLHGERPMRLVHQRSVKYEELTVEDVMTPLSAIDAVDYGALRHASVAELVDTLVHSGQQHLLVIEHASAAAPVRIRGIISKTQVERQLGAQLLSSEIATSFSEIGKALS
jgi:predicted transcriptional regulator